MNSQHNMQNEDDRFYPLRLDLPGPNDQGPITETGPVRRGLLIRLAFWLDHQGYSMVKHTLLAGLIGTAITWLFYPAAFLILVKVLPAAANHWDVASWGEQLLDNIRQR